ncbi:MAG: Alkaline phosphatase [Anaerolineae bacterium]|nr:MAG: Alkaline phosphatase [Anaerolineae bacterium]
MKSQFMRSLSLAFLLLLTCVRASVARDLQGARELESLPGRASAAGRVLNYGSEGDDTQIDLGTAEPETILQYGRAGNDTQYAAGSGANDWIEQEGGDGNNKQIVDGGTGNGIMLLYGGIGDDELFLQGHDADDYLYLNGGAGNDETVGKGGLGNDYIYLYGGSGDDTIRVGAHCEDLIRINGGSGADIITYDNGTGGISQVFIDGGTGHDELFIYQPSGINNNLTVLDSKGRIIYQYQGGTGGSVITIRNVCVTIIEYEIFVVYQSCGYESGMPGASGGRGGGASSRVAVDASGNVYVIGTSGAAWGANPVREFQGRTDAFVARLDANGALQWFTFLGGAKADYGGDIAVSGSEVYVVGTSYAAWGASPVRAYTALNDAFVAKLNATNGALLWHAFLGGAGDDYGNGIALDVSGNVYVAGTSSASWGTTMPRPFGDLHDAFAAKLNASGALQWNTFLGGAGIDEGADIATDASPNVYVVGSSTDEWGSGAVRAFTIGGWEAFAVELNASGALQWQTFLGSAEQDQGYAIVADAAGDRIYAAGSSTASWGMPQRAYSAWWDGFAVRLNGNGALAWNTFLGGGWCDVADGIALDGSGNVYVKGSGDAAWGTPVRDYSSGYDVYAIQLDPTTGAGQMLAFVGGEGDDFGDGIVIDASGNLILAGVNDVVWGTPVQSFGDAPNSFALKLDGSGALQWNTFFGGVPWATYLPLIRR